MKSLAIRKTLLAVCLAFLPLTILADTHYVWTNSPSPSAPYISWSSAAHDIQSAIDASSSNDTVLVTNGVYDTGGRALGSGTTSNRVLITNSVIVRSVNGPGVTTIKGMGPRGPTAVRCVYINTNAQVIGFTLSDGCTQTSEDTYGGGVWCESGAVVSNCVLSSNSANRGGGAYGGRLSGCVISHNWASTWGGGTYQSYCWNCEISSNAADTYGGGVCNGTIECSAVRNNTASKGAGTSYANVLNSTITSNTVTYDGGGVYGGAISECRIANNIAGRDGGGACEGTFSNCVFSDNSASADGGGAKSAILTDCQLERNVATSYGGGAHDAQLIRCTIVCNTGYLGAGTAYCDLSASVVASNASGNRCGGVMFGTADNCLITGNTATSGGHKSDGGTSGATVRNSTIVGNTAESFGGAVGGTLVNCIVYYNTDSIGNSNVSSAACTYTGTTPDPGGVGNITNEPMFVATNAGNYRLQAGSPCINRGNNAYVQDTLDLDGNPRIQQAVVDMGAYEFYQSAGIPSAWQTQYELPTNGCMDYWDSDYDGLFNWQEYVAGTVPIDSNSVLKLVEIASDYAGSNAVIAWQSVTGKFYTVERSYSLLDTPPFTNLESDISGLAGTTIYTDRTSSAGSANYRVKVE